MNPTSVGQGNGIYSGPKTAWVRVFSNGISTFAPNLQGFVMGGTVGFDDSYGFNVDGTVTIGVDAIGQPHTLVSSERALGDGTRSHLSDFPHRPPPSVISVESEFSGGQNSNFTALCRKTKISWTCYSLSQLEYLAQYFFVPRMSVLVEWGWNNYDPSSLVDLQNVGTLFEIFRGTQAETTARVQRSNGNYDLAMGFITDYNFSMNEVGGYDCTTTITNANYLVAGRSYVGGSTEGKDPNKTGGAIQLKDFVEFITDDVHNLVSTGNVSPQSTPASSTISQTPPSVPATLNTAGRVFTINNQNSSGNDSANSTTETWLRMDLVSDILNKFFTLSFVDPQYADTGTNAMYLDVKNIVVCGHPGLKSTSKDILIPNKYAPRFVSIESGSQHSEIGPNRLETLQVQGSATSSPQSPTGPYTALFPDVINFMKDHGFDESYDDLQSIINPSGNSFPQYSAYIPPNDTPGSADAGYWGMLEDIFVSVSFLKDLTEKNETVLKFVEELLAHISEAMCNISQLKLVPDVNGNQSYSVVDTNFSAITTSQHARKLHRISLGSVNSAYVRSVSFDVKLSGEMSNQMVMQSASGQSTDKLPANSGAATVDPKTMLRSRFSKGDRMFEMGILKNVETSNESPDSDKSEFTRLFTKDTECNFFTYTKTVGKVPTVYILCESEPYFLKSILINLKNAKAIYTNHAIMPGTNIELEFLGIAGITFLSQFTLDHVPSSYAYDQAVWQVSDVKQKIENKMWTTTVVAQARPLTSLQ